MLIWRKNAPNHAVVFTADPSVTISSAKDQCSALSSPPNWTGMETEWSGGGYSAATNLSGLPNTYSYDLPGCADAGDNSADFIVHRP